MTDSDSVPRRHAELQVRLWNSFLSSVFAAAGKSKGVVVDFSGGEVLLFWHGHRTAARATDAVLHIMHSAFHALPELPPNLRCTFGIATQRCAFGLTAGAVSECRLKYTVEGSAVRLARDLDSLNLRHGSNLVVCNATKLALDAEKADATIQTASCGLDADVAVPVQALAGSETDEPVLGRVFSASIVFQRAVKTTLLSRRMAVPLAASKPHSGLEQTEDTESSERAPVLEDGDWRELALTEEVSESVQAAGSWVCSRGWRRGVREVSVTPATPKTAHAHDEDEDEDEEKADDEKPQLVSLMLGSANEAARGLRAALGLFNESNFGDKIKTGLAAVEHEWRADAPRVTPEHRDNFRYVRSGIACKVEHLPEHVKVCIARGEYHGGKLNPGDFDHGHEGMTLESFHQVSQRSWVWCL